MSPNVLGVKLPDPPHSEAEVTPQSEHLRQILRDEEQRRQQNDTEIRNELVEVRKENAEIKQQIAKLNGLQWAVGIAVTAMIALFGGYITWKAATQQNQIVDAAEDKAIAVVDSRLRQHLQTVEQTSLNIAVEAVKIRDSQIEASRNPQPIAKVPDKLKGK